MRRFTFTPEALDAIRHQRYHHPHPRVQQKMEVLWLKSQGLSHEDVARLADVSRRSVQRYLDEFADGGLEPLRRLSWKGKPNELPAHQVSLEGYFLEHPPRSAREAQAAIERETGVRRGLTQVRAFLKKLSTCAGARSAPSRPGPTRRSKPTSWPTSSGPGCARRSGATGPCCSWMPLTSSTGRSWASSGAWYASSSPALRAASATTSWPLSMRSRTKSSVWPTTATSTRNRCAACCARSPRPACRGR